MMVYKNKTKLKTQRTFNPAGVEKSNHLIFVKSIYLFCVTI